MARFCSGKACIWRGWKGRRQHLGWGCDLAAAQQALQGAVPKDAARMRLTLDADGVIEVTSAPLPPSPEIWRVGLADVRLASDDPWLRIKSTRRAAYDAARAALPDDLDEVIFLNERAEVCDGSITTLFFDAGRGFAPRRLPAACCPEFCGKRCWQTVPAAKRSCGTKTLVKFGFGWGIPCAD